MSLERDRSFERALAREIAGELGFSIEPLIVLAEQRADAGAAEYGHDFPDLARDFEAEGCEEGADWSNYLRWRLDGIRRGVFDEHDWDVGLLQLALKHVALAFEATRHAKRRQETR